MSLPASHRTRRNENGDGRDDLVLGRPRSGLSDEEPSDPNQYGSRVGVVLGTVRGLPSGDRRMIHQDTPGVPGLDEAGTVAVIPGGASGPTGTGSKAFSQNTTGVPGAAERRDYFSEAVTLLDGDGDGRAGLVVGAPGENTNAGSVWALRSTASGVTTTGSLMFGAKALGTNPDGARLGARFPR